MTTTTGSKGQKKWKQAIQWDRRRTKQNAQIYIREWAAVYLRRTKRSRALTRGKTSTPPSTTKETKGQKGRLLAETVWSLQNEQRNDDAIAWPCLSRRQERISQEGDYLQRNCQQKGEWKAGWRTAGWRKAGWKAWSTERLHLPVALQGRQRRRRQVGSHFMRKREGCQLTACTVWNLRNLKNFKKPRCQSEFFPQKPRK